MNIKKTTTVGLGLALALSLAACGDDGGGGDSDAVSAKGPIKIWLSNNPEEIAWGKAMVKEWNAAYSEVGEATVTSAATDLSKVGSLVAAVDAFAVRTSARLRCTRRPPSQSTTRTAPKSSSPVR